ncbi:MAG: hypothetical protein H0W68_11755 [Gemmatimonadaceae bacterium]|nr:hypothetical protein [Gemmatimonadaceae bacterium]
MTTLLFRSPLLRGRALTAGMTAVAVALGGCYDYVAPLSGRALPGSEVRATLTDLGSAGLARLIGPNAASVDGRVERAGTDSLVLLVKSVETSSGAENGWSGERVAIPAAAVAAVRERQLSRTRTTLAVVTGVGTFLAVLLAQRASSADESSSTILRPPTGQ